MVKTHDFNYKGYNCSVAETKIGFFGIATKDDKIIEHLFPEKTLEKEIEELKFSIDKREQ